MADHRLVLDLALTLRHDGRGGVADDLGSPEALTAWVRERTDLPPAVAGFTADAAALRTVRELRAAVRALFARAVRPDPPSPADAQRLLPFADALAQVNSAAAAVPCVPGLEWSEGDQPRAVDRAESADAVTALCAALARAAVAFLAGPDRARLRACHAPRCVRYFLKEHPRQEWCGPSCGNRARVARHQRRHRAPA
ncbi:CGNR zinc finger domain-containing protein [Streptomyces sp. NPDC059070]|uniref:CGNR zinc finger domain-containing protein n=1 Tax=unclassified Streptomyces TaxID=2593676 RepID=UPI0034E2C831